MESQFDYYAEREAREKGFGWLYDREKVRRRLKKYDIKAINQDTRTYENEPLEYDYQAFLKLADEFDVKLII